MGSLEVTDSSSCTALSSPLCSLAQVWVQSPSPGTSGSTQNSTPKLPLSTLPSSVKCSALAAQLLVEVPLIFMFKKLAKFLRGCVYLMN